jgi:hypothetical protein
MARSPFRRSMPMPPKWRRSASRTSPPKSKSAGFTKVPCYACWISAPSSACCRARMVLLHISQIASERVNAVADYLKEGQVVKVKVIETDDKGRVRLSMKAIAAETAAPATGSRISDCVLRATEKDAAASFFCCPRVCRALFADLLFSAAALIRCALSLQQVAITTCFSRCSSMQSCRGSR